MKRIKISSNYRIRRIYLDNSRARSFKLKHYYFWYRANRRFYRLGFNFVRDKWLFDDSKTKEDPIAKKLRRIIPYFFRVWYYHYLRRRKFYKKLIRYFNFLKLNIFHE